MRKPWGYKDVLNLHAATGGFLHFMGVLKEKVPPAEFAKHETNLMEQFNLGVLDPDVIHALECSVPPGNLESVGFLRPAGLCWATFCFQPWPVSYHVFMMSNVDKLAGAYYYCKRFKGVETCKLCKSQIIAPDVSTLQGSGP